MMRKWLVVLAVAMFVAGTAFAAILPYYSVKRGIEAAAATLDQQAGVYSGAQGNITSADNRLAAFPTTFASVIETVNGYTPTGAAETLAKDEMAKLTAEYQTLKAKTDAMKACFTAVDDHGAAAVKAAVEAIQ